MYEDQFVTDYVTVAASNAGTFLGTKAGAIIRRIVVIAATTSPGAVTLQDGANTAITIYPGGATSLVDLKPTVIELGFRSTAGKFTVVTGANVSIIAIGRFL